MARPKPTIIIAKTSKEYFATEILATESITSLTYDGKPVSVRTHDLLTGKFTYPKVSSANPGHIQNLADKLNTQFNTDKFAVITHSDK